MMYKLEVVGTDRKKYTEFGFIPRYVKKDERYNYVERKFLRKYKKKLNYIEASKISYL